MPFLFKKQTAAPDAAPSLQITVMPDEFFGGKDPTIQYRGSGEHSMQPDRGNGVKPTPSAPIHAGVRFFSAHKVLGIVIVSVIGAASVAGISWYYVREARLAAARRQAAMIPTASQTEETPVLPEEELSAPLLAATTTPETSQVTTSIFDASGPPPSLQETPVEFPRPSFLDAADADSDSLTDAEEELFNTDSGAYDTDGDGYYDGQEVENLYNPKGTAPITLADSGLVREYVNPAWQYRLYYPNSWEAAVVDSMGDQTLLSAVTGDYIEIRASKKEAGETFSDWFGRVAIGESYSQLEPFTNRFLVDGWRRRDRLVAYYDAGTAVYVLLYHPKTTQAVPYRHVMELVLQSFRPVGTAINVPAQPSILEEQGESASSSL